MKYGLKAKTFEKIVGVLSENSKIEKVVLYGSRAKGNYREGSDIDLTIFGEGITVRDLNSISLKFDDLYLPYKVDLSIYDIIDNQEFLEHIDRIGIVVYEKKQRC